MCEPMTIMAGVGLALSTAATYQGAQAQKSMLQDQAATAAANAQINDAQAKRESEKGDREAEAIGRGVAETRARQRAALAANGADVNYGSALGLQEATDYYGMQDQMATRQNADDSDYAFRQEAANNRRGAASSSRAASAINPWMSAGGTLLSGAGKVADRWSAYKKPATPAAVSYDAKNVNLMSLG